MEQQGSKGEQRESEGEHRRSEGSSKRVRGSALGQCKVYCHSGSRQGIVEKLVTAQQALGTRFCYLDRLITVEAFRPSDIDMSSIKLPAVGALSDTVGQSFPCVQ